MTIQNRSIGFVALLSTVILSASAAVTPITFQPESRLAIAQLRKAVRTVEVSVPVQSLDCGNGTMNAQLRNALRMQANPTIEFRVAQYDVIPGGATEGTVRLKEILMSEFGVRPPTLTMGTLKVRDRVVVNFDAVLKQS